MTNTPRGVLYVGITSGLIQRVDQHRRGAHQGFTKRYGCRRLVWFEAYGEPHLAIAREKKVKRWRREWKFALVEKENPGWNDLWDELTGVPPESIVEPIALLA